ncbi:MAG: sigma-54 dependent transcriptional regulator [Syntrophaceae bacterium]
MKPSILVLDDEPNIVEVIITRLEALGYPVKGFSKPDQALDVLRGSAFSVLLTDLKMPEKDGMAVLKEAKRIDPDIEVIIFTAYGSIAGAVEAMQAGAYDYILKPFEPMELVAKIERAVEKRTLRQRVRQLEKEVEKGIENKIYAMSTPMKKVLSLTRQVSQSDATALILGESGTGKELIARMLHYESKRRDNNFVIMDCGATPATLLEAELFGYVKGSFTGAGKDKMGIIEEADAGTLFLDEIGNISPEMQTRLLRVLESGEFRRVGENFQRRVDIRVIAATNADLQAKVKEGSFREDLYYRLKVITINLPPLRERVEDIPGLAQVFLTEFSGKSNKKIKGIAKDALTMLTRHTWPGNVRELKNMLESAVVLCHGDMITADDLMLSGFGELSSSASATSIDMGLNRLEEQEKAMVVEALKKARWVQKDAAKILGISRRVMHYKVRKFGIVIEGKGEDD